MVVIIEMISTQHMYHYRFSSIGPRPDLHLPLCTISTCPSVGHRRLRPAQCTAARQTVPPINEESPLVRLGVGATTQLLRLINLGRTEADLEAIPRRLEPVRPGDIDAVMERIAEDFKQHAYFVTGDIWEGIYASDCYFVDPTVSFKGLQKWRRNLQLLVPFLTEPRIDLYSLERIAQSAAQTPVQLKAMWRLSSYLKLPWQPYIDILGETEYTLDASSSKVVRHVESWNVSGTEAILQMLRPSTGKERE